MSRMASQKVLPGWGHVRRGATLKTDIDATYVINLEWRTERWDAFLAQSDLWEKAFGSSPKRFPAVAGIKLPGYDDLPWFTGRISAQRKKAWGGKAGAILSHREAIRLASADGCENVLIVEDDAVLTEQNVEVLRSGFKSFLDGLGEDWSAIYLFATSPITPCKVPYENQGYRLVEASGAFGAVAYILNGRILQQLLEELPDEQSIWRWVARHKTIDRWYSQNLARFGRVYLFAPSIVGHNCVGSSDISMSAENDWQLDFTLADLRLVEHEALFRFLLSCRRTRNALNRLFSVFRLLVKSARGL